MHPSKLRKLARKMRRFPTRAEAVLENHCRLLGLNVRSQICVAGRIVDIFLPQIQVALEADGSAHNNREKRDSLRDIGILQQRPALQIKRYKNEAILNDPLFREKLRIDLLAISGFTKWPYQ